MRAILLLVTLGLAIYAMIDLLRSRSDEVQNLPRALWALLILVVPIAGPVGYLVLGRGQSDGGSPQPRSRGVVGPDDDPDFLRTLDDENRRQHPAPGEPGDDEAPQAP